MPNTYFQFQQFRINQEKSGMKVTTDACLFGAWVAQLAKESKQPKHILDIGSGTGLLSLMLAQVTPADTTIDAIEINEQAYLEAKENFARSPWKERLHVNHVALQAFETDRKYDLIICNPPFFNNNQKGKTAARNLALHNEHLSFEDLAKYGKNLLSEEGIFYVLYPEKEMMAFTSEAVKSGLNTPTYVYVKNERNHPIFRIMRGFTLVGKGITASEVIIREETGKYTTEFWSLLKDYYLKYNDPSL